MATINLGANAEAGKEDQGPAAKTPGTFVRDHFSVLIVFAVFALLLLVYVLELHWSGNDHVTNWLEGQMNQLIGALLMGLTSAGVALAAARKP